MMERGATVTCVEPTQRQIAPTRIASRAERAEPSRTESRQHRQVITFTVSYVLWVGVVC
jgi:hypothetical protein